MDDNKSNMIGTFAVSNEMLYELLRDFKADMNRRFDDVDRRFDEVDRKFQDVEKRFEEVNQRFVSIDQRFESIDRHFEAIDKRFEAIDRHFERIERRLDEFEEKNRREHEAMSEKLDEIYRSRDRVTVNFTKTWAFASLMIAVLSSALSMAFTNIA